MTNFIKRLFSKHDDFLSQNSNSNISFILSIGNLKIGYLTYENDEWIFKYSKDFKVQQKYKRITGFSDLNKTYRKDVLWPFFKIRIPGLKQPMIKEIIDAENIDVSDEALLLKRFGKKIRSNPYILEYVV